MSDPTDPTQLPGTDPHSGNRKFDPVSGYDTTGHDWNGIKELNTPFPRLVIWALVLTFLYSVVAWVLLPPGRPGVTTRVGFSGWISKKRPSKAFATSLNADRIGCRVSRVMTSMRCSPTRP